jgi:metal-responsive CopG/Arc/MetJ family transcriptional regulator
MDAMNGEYATIKLPIELLEQIEKIIDSNKYGYKTKPEFIKEAIRKHLELYKTFSRSENG